MSPFMGAPFAWISSGTGSTYQATASTYGFANITDGTSNTLLMAEVIQGQAKQDGTTNDLRGFVQYGSSSGFSAWLTPNSQQYDLLNATIYCSYPFANNPPCYPDRTAMSPYRDIYAARSRHPGGVNTGLCDGSVKFFKNSINLLTWRALSTTQGNEVLSADAF